MPYPGGIPSLVWSSIGRLVAAEAGEDTQRPVRIRVRAGDGSWAVIEAARLDPNREIAVTVHAAGIDEILGLICRAHGLSTRQRELVTLVAQGQDTAAIAGQMVISRYTVQDHLKSIFGKLGVHSRLELLTRLFAQAAWHSLAAGLYLRTEMDHLRTTEVPQITIASRADSALG